MNLGEKFAVGTGVVFLIGLLLVAVGWCMNIVDLVVNTGETTGLFIARVAGLFIPPLGAILGFFF